MQGVLAQTLPAGYEIEVLVADGMSDDCTREVLGRYERTHPNVRVIDNQQRIVSAGLNMAIRESDMDITVHAAAEYFLDEHVEQMLKKNEPLLTISGKMVLVEFSMAYPPQGLKDILFELQMQGYQPVIAHPERYIYLERARDFYDELKETGCLFQLNLLSITGYYGKSPQELAQYLIKKSYYDLVGTDLHGFRHLDALRNPVLEAQLKKVMDTGKIRNANL